MSSPKPRYRRAWLVLGAVLAMMSTGGAVAWAHPSTPAPEPLVPGTPCVVSAEACVDRAAKLAWLIEDGQVIRGPVPVQIGGPGKETPTGSFVVEWKHKDHRSSEFNNAPMPYSVFFAAGGIAFHEGTLANWSAGCVRLRHDDAVAFFDYLQVGDQVQVHPGAETPAAD